MISFPKTIGKKTQAYYTNTLNVLDTNNLIFGKRILEIGCNSDLALASILSQNGASVVHAINFFDEKYESLPSNVFYTSADAAKTPFDNNSFDLILAVNVIEHIRDFHGVSYEIKRLLSTGGMAYLNGGPIWTSWNGHHLWVNMGNAKYRFNNLSNPIMPWEHLFYNAQEMKKVLELRGLTKIFSELVIGSIYESKYNGRLSPAHASNKLRIADILKAFSNDFKFEVWYARNRGPSMIQPNFYYYNLRESYSEEELNINNVYLALFNKDNPNPINFKKPW